MYVLFPRMQTNQAPSLLKDRSPPKTLWHSCVISTTYIPCTYTTTERATVKNSRYTITGKVTNYIVSRSGRDVTVAHHFPAVTLESLREEETLSFVQSFRFPKAKYRHTSQLLQFVEA